jgi:lambda repressor-like predicted transcriptional regulator
MSKKTPLNTLIEAEMKKKGLRPADLARKLRLSVSTTYYLLSRPSIQVDRLWQISKILEINFFQILADQLNLEDDSDAFKDDEKEALKAENATLKEVIKMLGGR